MQPPHLDLCEDLSELESVNESSVLHTLISRAKANMPLTQAGPNLINLWPPLQTSSKAPKSRMARRWWDAPPALAALVKRVYVSLVDSRRDHCVCAVGRSGTGKTAACRAFAVALLKQAGTAGPNLSVARCAGHVTVLKSFGCVTSAHSEASSRFATLFSLDFNHAGRAAAGHLQTMMLDKWRVCQMTAGESNFLVFSQLLAGLSAEMRSELQLHQLAEQHAFGMAPPTKVEEKQRASVAFAKLLVAMETLGFSASEQKAIWHVLAGIYHLGAAGACKVGRRQFLNFDSAQAASSVLGCEGEEFHTLVFKHHLRHLLRKATGSAREHSGVSQAEEGPRLTAAQCLQGMASALYEELFTAVVSLINRSLSGQQLALASVMVADAPGLRNPRHHAAHQRAADFSDFCHNYLQERLAHYRYVHAFTNSQDIYAQENIQVELECPESKPADVVSAIDQPVPQVRAAGDAPRGLLWALDEEMWTPASDEGAALEHVCRHFSNSVRQCEQPLHCEVQHLAGSDAVRYDLSGWLDRLRNNPAAGNAGELLRNSHIVPVKSLFTPSGRANPACGGVCGLEGWSQRCLQRSSIVRKTLSAGTAALRRHSPCIGVKLQADALVNVLRRARPVFLQCMGAEADAGAFDTARLRAQLEAAQTLAVLRAYRTGYPDHMALSDFRCHFQALSPPIMKRYASMFVSHDERKAVDELLADLDLEPNSVAVGASRVFMKRGVLRHLEAQRDLQVTGWLVHLQAACAGHLARHKYRTLKVQHMAVQCLQRNLRVLRGVSEWRWWKLFCRVRPLLDVNMDNERLRAKEEELSGLRRRLEKSEKERNDLRQTVDACETKLTAVTSELSDERFRGDAVAQALDVERAERLRLSKENKDLQARLDQCALAMETLEKNLEVERQKIRTLESRQLAGTESELALQLECCQTEADFLRRRLQQTEEKALAERDARQQADAKVASLQAQLDQSKRAATELKRHNRRLGHDLHDARVMTDNLRNRTHQLERKQRRFDGELAAALAEADGERELKDKSLQENAALGVQIFSLRRDLQESRAEACRLQRQKDELCSQIRDLSVHLTAESLPELKKQARCLEGVASERAEEIAALSATVERHRQVHVRTELEMARVKQMHQKELEDKEEELEDVHRSSQRRLRQLEMQLEQEYEEKQMVLHDKQDLEALVATLCEQVGHRDFDVEKKLRRDLKRTHALLADAQTLLGAGQSRKSPDGGSAEQLERLHCQLEESESRRREVEAAQSTLTQELEDLHVRLEDICKEKTLADEELCVLRREKVDLLKRLEEDQDDLNQLMKKHKALIAQSSGDICQIRELQAELEEVKKQRHGLQEELQQQASRLHFLESSTVGRSIVSKQEARVCDLENKLEFSKGQVKRFEVLVLRLRDSVVRLGEELEQSAQSEARQRDTARYFQQRLQDLRVEMEELDLRQQESGRRRMELEMQVEELTAIRQTLQADLETSIRRIVDLQAALEEVRSSDDSDSDRESSRAEDALAWRGTASPRGGGSGGSDTLTSQAGCRSPADSCGSRTLRSLEDPDETDSGAGRPGGGLGRAASSSALSELLEGLRKRRVGSTAEVGGALSLGVCQPTAAAALRRRASALSVASGELPEARPGILKPTSPLLPRSAASSATPPCGSTAPALPRLSLLASSLAQRPSSPGIPEEDREQRQRSPSLPRGVTFQNRHLLGEWDAASVASDLSDVPPAVRRAQSAGSLTGSLAGSLTGSLVGSVRGGRRTLSVRFGDLPPSTRRGRDSATESSGSGSSAESREPTRPRRRSDQPRGERLEAEGSEGGDVASVMRKYLNKESD
ncbi:LOW QUALITY PROTEIN: unconventional myosin-XVIIIb-like [Syngnathus acus]|uniref:LOW QUALITY PROTEIN: unconventional myosin-XVIIIb-like n=1 Tax=Syngnathus acus TaxID=161584 RepID=UPI00188615F3|nr:LOW QUALITY PROTEIN: unconventional myosin-XVIIIb-like [Syngnathus acus]